jgi:cobalt-precorrin-7 (C5)-methyltransferase
MAMNRPQIVIVGCGPGAAEYLTEAARNAVAGAEVLAGSPRLLALFADHPGRKITVTGHVSDVLDEIAAAGESASSVAVLVSGDPGVFSLAAKLIERFGREHCQVVPGVSAVQVAFARLGLAWTDARLLSAHGRTPQATIEELAGCDKIAVLLSGQDGFQWVATVADSLQSSHVAYLCENLTLENERLALVEPGKLTAGPPSGLALVLLIRRALLS